MIDKNVPAMGTLVLAVRREDFGRSGIFGVTEHVVVHHIGPDTWPRVATGLISGTIIGAAVVHEISIEELPSATERRGELFVFQSEAELVEVLEDQGWTVRDRWDTGVVLAPPDAPIAVTEISAEEFSRRIAEPEPLSTTVDPREVQLDDDRLFGMFASTGLGGSSALLALSGARPGELSVELRNPAALGLVRVDNDPRSVVAATGAGILHCKAIGLSGLDEPERWDCFVDGEAMSVLWGSRGFNEERFSLMVELAAPDLDPPVWLPAGQIFEQLAFNGRQTLATCTGVNTVVSPGRLTAFLLPAFCLDQHLLSPTSDQMRATPFRMPISPGMTQEEAWSQRAAALGVRR